MSARHYNVFHASQSTRAQGLWWLPTAEDAAARSGGVLPGGEGGAGLLRLVRG